MRTHNIKFIDEKERKEFEKLFGFIITGNYIEIPHKMYLKFYAKIDTIRFDAKMRNEK